MNYWFENPTVLIEKKKMTNFFPRNFMTHYEKVNAIARFAFYYLILNVFLFKNYKWISVSVTLFIISFIFSKIKNTENFSNNDLSNCKHPTINNPYMNRLVYDKNTESACDTTNKEIRKKMLEFFDPEEYNPFSNIWSRSISDRQFYTLPSTGIVNKQKDFALSLYGNDDTCKIDSKNCIKNNSSKFKNARYI